MAKDNKGATDPAWEMVTIKLFKDSGKYKDPLFVAVNNHRYMIERGQEVEIPRFIAEHIDEMAKADEQTASMIGELTKQYEENTKKAG